MALRCCVRCQRARVDKIFRDDVERNRGSCALSVALCAHLGPLRRGVSAVRRLFSPHRRIVSLRRVGFLEQIQLNQFSNVTSFVERQLVTGERVDALEAARVVEISDVAVVQRHTQLVGVHVELHHIVDLIR